MKLSAWLSEKKKKPMWLADKLGVSTVSARRYCNGERRPEYEVMLAIYQLTGGRVTPNDFYELPNLNEDNMVQRSMAAQLSLLDVVAAAEAQACA